MAKGIYERKGKNGDVTYYIRYQFKTIGFDGAEFIKDLKEKVGRKSRGFTREMARDALKAREGGSHKADSTWSVRANPTRSPNYLSVITSTQRATKHLTAARNTLWWASGNTSRGATFPT